MAMIKWLEAEKKIARLDAYGLARRRAWTAGSERSASRKETCIACCRRACGKRE